jgi:arylsulfatase
MKIKLSTASLSSADRRHLSRRFTALSFRALAATLALSANFVQCFAEPARRPNIVVILADDLGFSDLGCYGGEIRTPNLDALAAGGLRFTQFYNTARCWPTRAALLTGYYAQQVRRDTVPGVPSGGSGVRPAWARLLPELLKPLGYRSYHSGKWHIDGMPVAGGFDRSYLLQDQGRFFSPREHYDDDQKLPPVEPDSGYYATIAIADHAVKCLREHADKHAQRSFFSYVAFTSPHFPLQALPEDIAGYRGRYLPGWEKVRRERYERMRKLGIVDCPMSAVERDVGPPYDFPKALKTLGPGEVNRPLAWDDLNDEQREFQAAKMAIHAAMIDRMDREIGRILDQLRSMGALDDTIVFFLSDNGASAEIMVRDDGHDPSAPPGSAATHLCLGPGWSTVANTPLRRHKTWVHEGGISTPLIVHWPGGIRGRGELRRNPGHVIDLVPTALEVAGGPRAETWRGKPIPTPPGRSLLPAFAVDRSVPRDELWWLHEGHRAIRVGDWKLVASGENGPWELYDLGVDRGESHNLALGSWISYALGTENDNLPAYIVLRDPEGYNTSGTLLWQNGWLPAEHRGTEVATQGAPVLNLVPRQPVAPELRRGQLNLLARLNERHRLDYPHESELEARIRNYELAARMQLAAGSLLDLNSETAETQHLYGLDRPETAGYGMRCLMARRLIESGVRFVQVFPPVKPQFQPWDAHANVKTDNEAICAKCDQPSAALITDLKRRGLLEETLVIWSGEFGRLPVSQNGSGRDHNRNAFSLLLSGGGVRGGYVHGATDEVGYRAAENRVSVHDLHATVLYQLGLDHRRVTYYHHGSDESLTDARVTRARVVEDLLA